MRRSDRRFNLKPSFEVKTARVNHICIFCGNTIKKGTKYYSKPENNKMIDKLLEEKTGYDIYTIKSRTHFFYCDRISWAFCSLFCMYNFSKSTWETLPFNVRGRMGAKIVSIVKKIEDVLGMMTALGGSEGKTGKDSSSK